MADAPVYAPGYGPDGKYDAAKDPNAAAKTAKTAGLDKQWKTTQDNNLRVQTGLEDSATAAHAALGEYDTAGVALKQGQEAATQQLRRQAAASIAGMQGRSAGGGGQLAALNQASLDRGVAEGAMNADWLQRAAQNRLGRNQAQQSAAQADIDVGTGLEKLNQAAQSGVEAANLAATDIQNQWAQLGKDHSFVNGDDKNLVIERLRARYANDPNPAVRQRAEAEIAKLSNTPIYGAFEV